jgi:hypothetical protein
MFSSSRQRINRLTLTYTTLDNEDVTLNFKNYTHLRNFINDFSRYVVMK